MAAEQRPRTEVREGVRRGVLAALAHDFELIGARTARRLLAAGVVGVAGALAVTLLVSGHPLEDHHPPWHVLVFSTIWAGLLIVSLSLMFLRVRTPRLRIARAATVGVIGLGLAGLCSVFCPDQHFLSWWTTTPPGAWAMASGGLAVSALCFGLVTTIAFGAAAALIVLRDRRGDAPQRLLPATALLFMLEPGVILQSVGTPLIVLGAWTLGTGLGSYAGITAGLFVRLQLLRK